MRGGTWRYVALLCACAVGIATGCGDDADGDARRQVAYSIAPEPPEAFALRMAKLLETSTTRADCAQLDQIAARSPAGLACPASKTLRRSMRRFDVVGAKEYGTAAVVDYRSGGTPDGAAILLFVTPDREWAVSRFGVVTGAATTRTDDEQSRDGFRKAVEDYLTAIRTRDCRAFAAVAFTGDAERAVVCRAFPSTKAMARRLEADPTARPRYEGGNATFGFFSLETDKPEPTNETLSVIATSPGSPRPYVVLDVVPSPTTDQQEAILDLVEQGQTETNGEPEPSPSRKAD